LAALYKVLRLERNRITAEMTDLEAAMGMPKFWGGCPSGPGCGQIDGVGGWAYYDSRDGRDWIVCCKHLQGLLSDPGTFARERR
jgi:hypothetical protein